MSLHLDLYIFSSSFVKFHPCSKNPKILKALEDLHAFHRDAWASIIQLKPLPSDERRAATNSSTAAMVFNYFLILVWNGGWPGWGRGNCMFHNWMQDLTPVWEQRYSKDWTPTPGRAQTQHARQRHTVEYPHQAYDEEMMDQVFILPESTQIKEYTVQTHPKPKGLPFPKGNPQLRPKCPQGSQGKITQGINRASHMP
jgi:hypothetical protein